MESLGDAFWFIVVVVVSVSVIWILASRSSDNQRPVEYSEIFANQNELNNPDNYAFCELETSELSDKTGKAIENILEQGERMFVAPEGSGNVLKIFTSTNNGIGRWFQEHWFRNGRMYNKGWFNFPDDDFNKIEKQRKKAWSGKRIRKV